MGLMQILWAPQKQKRRKTKNTFLDFRKSRTRRFLN